MTVMAMRTGGTRVLGNYKRPILPPNTNVPIED